MRSLTLSALLLLASGVATPALAQTANTPAPSARPAVAASSALDSIAHAYVMLILRIGEHEAGYVDAYYGPAEWRLAAQADKRTPQALANDADGLLRLLERHPVSSDPVVEQRRRFLSAHVSAAAARLRMIMGERMSFADEAEALFGIRPELRPLESFDPIVARIEAVYPGEGTVNERVAARQARRIVPADRFDAVARAGIAECKRRTEQHIALPAGERFTMELVKDEPWGAYNYYQGDSVSLIQVNTDLPNSVGEAVNYGCHEGYPGHHTYNAMLEQTFTDGRGWVEMSIYPLYSPMSFIAEGTGNYGIELAFPGEERENFERETLYPMAGLDTSLPPLGEEINELFDSLVGVTYTIADDFLADRADRETTLQRMMKYNFQTRPQAEKSLSFVEVYRSYIINYTLGEQVVKAWVERQGPDHWVSMNQLLTSQTLPSDLI